MRWHGRIWPIARLSLLGVAFWSGVAFSEPMAPWLPGVEDDVERPDSLEEAQPVFSGALLRGGLRAVAGLGTPRSRDVAARRAGGNR
jgi:hypothetical protein